MKFSKALVALATVTSTTVLGGNNLPVFSQNYSVVGCWRGGSSPALGSVITHTHIFNEDGRYEGYRTGSSIAALNVT